MRKYRVIHEFSFKSKDFTSFPKACYQYLEWFKDHHQVKMITWNDYTSEQAIKSVLIRNLKSESVRKTRKQGIHGTGLFRDGETWREDRFACSLDLFCGKLENNTLIPLTIKKIKDGFQTIVSHEKILLYLMHKELSGVRCDSCQHAVFAHGNHAGYYICDKNQTLVGVSRQSKTPIYAPSTTCAKFRDSLVGKMIAEI